MIDEASYKRKCCGVRNKRLDVGALKASTFPEGQLVVVGANRLAALCEQMKAPQRGLNDYVPGVSPFKLVA